MGTYREWIFGVQLNNLFAIVAAFEYYVIDFQEAYYILFSGGFLHIKNMIEIC